MVIARESARPYGTLLLTLRSPSSRFALIAPIMSRQTQPALARGHRVGVVRIVVQRLVGLDLHRRFAIP